MKRMLKKKTVKSKNRELSDIEISRPDLIFNKDIDTEPREPLTMIQDTPDEETDDSE